MCELKNIGELIKEEDPPEFKGSNALFGLIYSGVVSPLSLPKSLYDFTFYNVIYSIANVYGLPSDFEKGSPFYKKAVKMKNSVSIFSGAKTFQNVMALSNEVFTGGVKRPLNEFKKIAVDINDDYQVKYLRAELNAAFRQSETAKQWDEIQKNKEILPLLKYSTVGDNRVRDQHRNLDGIIKPVDDPFWDTWMPQNDWNCRCIVEQLESGNITKGSFEENDSKTFGGNVGKNGLIFPKTHPYSKVPKEFKEAKGKNFGFVTPSDKQIKNIINGNS